MRPGVGSACARMSSCQKVQGNQPIRKKPPGMKSSEARCSKEMRKNVTTRPKIKGNQKEAKNIRQHGGHFEKIFAWVFFNHHEDVIYKKLRQNPMICFLAVDHFENSYQHGGHFEKLIAWVFVNHHEDVIYKNCVKMQWFVFRLSTILRIAANMVAILKY